MVKLLKVSRQLRKKVRGYVQSRIFYSSRKVLHLNGRVSIVFRDGSLVFVISLRLFKCLVSRFNEQHLSRLMFESSLVDSGKNILFELKNGSEYKIPASFIEALIETQITDVNQLLDKIYVLEIKDVFLMDRALYADIYEFEDSILFLCLNPEFFVNIPKDAIKNVDRETFSIQLKEDYEIPTASFVKF